MPKKKKKVGFSYKVTQTWVVRGILPVKTAEELIEMIESGKAEFHHGKSGIVIDEKGYEVDVEMVDHDPPTNFEPE